MNESIINNIKEGVIRLYRILQVLSLDLLMHLLKALVALVTYMLRLYRETREFNCILPTITTDALSTPAAVVTAVEECELAAALHAIRGLIVWDPNGCETADLELRACYFVHIDHLCECIQHLILCLLRL